MAAKVAAKSHPLNGSHHTAGIFADMTVDGPIIGTLVAIVDRAKNLPNRKTIGKQDPYCAARLGKEAKKTATDVRGGQTPKWDQELRFTVHDSPDYYQLKISVFTDDKRTDLIGESWIDLRSIIVSGGGQSDIWQGLTCRGKYAGEIRIEITFYDTRPKPDKPVAKPKQVSAEKEQGSAKQRTPVKRRPLPSDPVTGEAPAVAPAPAAAPAPAPVAAPASAPAPAPAPSGQEHHTPPRGHAKQSSHPGYISNQSLQAIEYNTPPPQHSSRSHHSEQHSPSPHAHAGSPHGYTPPSRGEVVVRQAHRPMDSYDNQSRQLSEREYSPKYAVPPHEHQDPRGHYAALPDPYGMPPMNDPRHQLQIEDRPPPPPVHRSRHNSGGQEIVLHRGGYDSSPPKSSQMHLMRQDVLRNEAHRYSMPAYPGRPTFRAYDSAPAAPNPLQPPTTMTYEPSAQRHHSYDSSYDPHPRSLQPTVEDVPESPPDQALQSPHRHSESQEPAQEEMSLDLVPSPAPLNFSRSAGASPAREIPSPIQAQHGYPEQNDYQLTISPLSSRNRYSQSPGQVAYHQNSSQNHRYSHPADLETTQFQGSPGYGLPALPPSLVPGIDPALSQEISERIYEDRRHQRRYIQQNASNSTRGRQRNEPVHTYVPGSAHSSQTYIPPSYPEQYDRRGSITYSGGPDKPRTVSPNPNTSPNPQHQIRRKSVSPAPQHTIRRKSVSPAPPQPEQRRSSGVIPFGPDSYDALNPSMVSSNDGTPTTALVDPDAKIITYDGREIDPSDHLPMETWAPEPDKPQKEPSPEPRTRPTPAGAQPMPPSTRRQPRASRPHSMSVSSLTYGSEEPHTPPGPNSAGRTRLQKRTNRASAGPSPAASSPLAPITPDNYQDRQSPYTPTRGLPRASTWDYPNENYAPMHGSGPPVPAKIPLAIMSGPSGGSGNELALMEEMQRIDIGSGRSRRRGGY